MLSPSGSNRPLCLLPQRVAASRTWLSASLALLLTGCAHTQGADSPKERDEAAEVEALRQRLIALEAHVSDLDAQLDQMARRSAAPSAPTSISLGPSGAPAPVYQPPPAYRPPVAYTPPPSPAPARKAAPVYAGIGEAAVDLGSRGQQGSAYLQPAAEGIPPEVPPTEAASAAREPAPSPPLAEPVARPPNGTIEVVYKWARERMKAKDYPAAIAGFEDILARNLDHHLADNALYWTAVCHLEMGKPRLAISVWSDLPLRFPGSPKMADALFGMASAHEVLGEVQLAETLYAQLVEQYPRAERAPEARDALERLARSNP